MSQYENYDDAARSYDSIRSAFGDDVIAGMLQFYSGKAFQDLDILDAGCGTGNYAKSMVELGARSVTMMDASAGMLKQAKFKLTDAIESGKVKEVVQTMLPTIPFNNSRFDAVMFNMVLHHLQRNPDGFHYPEIEKALTEARRVIKSDGVLTISSLNPKGEYMDKLWYLKINPDITERHKKLYPQMSKWKEILQRTGFRFLTAMDVHIPISCDLVMDIEGPAKKEWRNGDSYWASATPEEIEVVEKKIKTMKENGTLEEFFKNTNMFDDHFTFTYLFAVPTNI